MLPIERWPEFLYRVARSLVAPQRAALDLRRRLDRQWQVNRELNFEIQNLKQQNADLKGLVANNSSELNHEIQRLNEQLSYEQSRHKETALNLEREAAKNLVLADQMQVLVQWIETYKTLKEAEARIENLRGRKQGEE